MSESVNAREIVLDLLLEQEKNNIPFHIILRDTLRKYQYLDKKDRSFIKKLAKGTVEKRLLLDYILNQFSKMKTNKMKPFILTLLRMETYEILFMDTKSFAICNEAVSLAKKRGFFGLSGFVNGLLRTIIREKDSIKYPDRDKDIREYYSIMYSIPKWLVGQLFHQYGDDAVKIIEGLSTEKGRVSVRINKNIATKEEVINSLKDEDIEVVESSLYDGGIYISGFDYIDKITAFKEGKITPQDVSSMLVSYVALPLKLSDEKYEVIDMCAAPGGKAIHMAELLKDKGHVSARDVSLQKVMLLNENIERNGAKNIDTMVLDATITDDKSIESADIVICDAPCSGIGVIAKKSDIKYNISYDSENELCALQKEILKNAVKYLKKGGILIYSTCTINKSENEENMKWIISELGLKVCDISEYFANGFHEDETRNGYLRLLPGIDETDGFFISKFVKE